MLSFSPPPSPSPTTQPQKGGCVLVKNMIQARVHENCNVDDQRLYIDSFDLDGQKYHCYQVGFPRSLMMGVVGAMGARSCFSAFMGCDW